MDQKTLQAQHHFDDSVCDMLDMLKDRVDCDVIDALKDTICEKARLLVRGTEPLTISPELQASVCNYYRLREASKGE